MGGRMTRRLGCVSLLVVMSGCSAQLGVEEERGRHDMAQAGGGNGGTARPTWPPAAAAAAAAAAWRRRQWWRRRQRRRHARQRPLPVDGAVVPGHQRRAKDAQSDAAVAAMQSKGG